MTLRVKHKTTPAASTAIAEESFSKRINIWLQNIGIVMAGVWGLYTFYYGQVIVPKSSPVNISIDLKATRIESDELRRAVGSTYLIPIELRVVARNPSSREVYLLPSVWYVTGAVMNSATYTKGDLDSSSGFRNIEIVGALNAEQPVTLQRYGTISKLETVALGRLFSDDMLKPGEVIARTLIFYVPARKYNQIFVYAMVPTALEPMRFDLKWSLDGENCTVIPTIYNLLKDGSKGPIVVERNGKYINAPFDLQTARSDSQLFLEPISPY